MIVIESPKFCKMVSWFIDVYAITLWPFIICRDKSDKLTVNHEKIHIEQQKELLVIGFFILYLMHWFLNVIYYKFDFFKAYEKIVFEKEAYDKEEDFEYLDNRSPYSWIKYLKSN